MVKRIVVSIMLISAFYTEGANAQEFAPVGTAVAQFLEIGLGARPTALGEAFTSVANDAGSVFWNPAGLVRVEDINLFMAYNRWPAEINIGGFSIAMNFKNIGTIAISTTYLSTGDMLVTTVEDPEGKSGNKFGITNYAAGISYARTLTNRLSAGITGKMIREKYMDYGYYGWALDMGLLYDTGFHGLTLGMAILHFGGDVQFDGSYFDYSDPLLGEGEQKSFETYSLPINFRIGANFDIINQEEHHLITVLDMVHPNNNLEQYNLGFEYGFRNTFFIRTGYRFRADEGGFAIGLGVNYDIFGDKPSSIDYSFSEMGIITDIHRLSVSLSF